MTDAAVAAAGKLSAALETKECARGHLYAFHQLTGRADAQLTPEQLNDYRRAVTSFGARDAVTERIETLMRHSMIDLSRAQLSPQAEQQLAEPFRAATGVTPHRTHAATHRAAGKAQK